MRAGYYLQLREGLLHAGRVHHRRGGPGNIQEERSQGHRSTGSSTGGWSIQYLVELYRLSGLFLYPVSGQISGLFAGYPAGRITRYPVKLLNK